MPYLVNEGGTLATPSVPTAGATDFTGFINATLWADLQTIETFLANNPNGAILTAAQVAVVARMLSGIVRVLLEQTGSIGQAT